MYLNSMSISVYFAVQRNQLVIVKRIVLHGSDMLWKQINLDNFYYEILSLFITVC